MGHEPKTLQQAIQYFADPDNCLDYLVTVAGQSGIVCPTCGSGKCLSCRRAACGSARLAIPSASSPSRSEPSSRIRPSALDKWLTAIWMIANCKNGISSWEIHRATGRHSEVRMVHAAPHPARPAGQATWRQAGGGEVEVDETFIGGKARNMHMNRGAERVMNRHWRQGQDRRRGHARTRRQGSRQVVGQPAKNAIASDGSVSTSKPGPRSIPMH